MMTIFKKSNSDFYAGYFAARIILDKTGNAEGAAASADAISGGPIPPTRAPCYARIAFSLDMRADFD